MLKVIVLKKVPIMITYEVSGFVIWIFNILNRLI